MGNKLTEDMLMLRRGIVNAAMHKATASGDVATFRTDNTLKLPRMVVNINPVQSGSGDPSPDNVRPITGWTGAQIVRSGKNLFNLADYTTAGWTRVSDAGYADTYTGNKYAFYRLYGNVSNNPDSLGLLGMRIPLGRVTISFYKYLSNNDRVYFHYVGDESWTNHSGNLSTTGFLSFTSTAGKICDGVGFYTTQGNTAVGEFGQLQVEISDQQTEYEPFKGSMFPVSWQTEAGTVYDGSLDLTTGVLTVTHGLLTLADKSWTLIHGSVADYFRATIETLNPRAKAASVNGLCSAYRLVAGSAVSSANNQIGVNATSVYLYVRDDRYSDESSFIAAMGDVQLCYELATPLTYQLTPIGGIRPLIGMNHIWADCGSVSLDYWEHN